MYFSGKTFNLTVTLHTNPLIEVITVPNTVKVTVDGPRDSRTANKYYMQGECGPLDELGGDNLNYQHVGHEDHVLDERPGIRSQQSDLDVVEEVFGDSCHYVKKSG